MTEERAEPKRVIHEVCSRVPGDFALYGGSDEGDPMSIISGDVVIIASVTMFEHETYDPPQWVRYGIDHKGWWIRHRDAPPTGLDFHGAVDWRTVAVSLAEAVAGHKKPTAAEQKALDDYGIALAEEALATESHERDPDPEEGSDES